jgi:REP element-mobilizing transposase RayT
MGVAHRITKPALKGRKLLTMGQSLVKNYIHIVFSTKHRQPIILPQYEDELHSYLGGICKNLDCQPIKVGGYTDHIHILCMLSKKIALMKLLEEVKSHSSKWMKTKDEQLKNFYWQDGYGAFSVNPAEIDRVIAYIANQHEHHSKKTFQDEYRAFLKKYNVEYDERYVWD